MNTNGLGLIKGRVSRLKRCEDANTKVRIPHIGWNRLLPVGTDDKQSEGMERLFFQNEILRGVSKMDYFYFDHSFAVIPKNLSHILTETEYGINRFCSIVKKNNIVGCQFHPERSGASGLKIYYNFITNL